MQSLRHFLGLDSQTIGRKKYLIANLIVHVTVVVLVLALAPLAETIAPLTLFIVFVSVSGAYIGVATTIRRLRNIGLNPWWTALLFVPFISFLFFIFLCVKKGKVS